MQRPAGGMTADALPTVQIDGVVWTQAVHGNTVYAGGSFANARPAGSAAGQNQTPRQNFLSYDLTTGKLDSSFNHPVNGVIKDIAVSPDGTRLYIAGSFTSVDGQARYRLAAFDTATGGLIASFKPTLNTTVAGIAVTNSTVYAGGWFNVANGNSRSRVAAFNASNGALLGWAPTTDGDIQAMTMSPDQSKVILGGKFQNLNSSPAMGTAAVDAVNGSLLPFNVNTVVRNGNSQAGTYSLNTDNDTVYGTNFNFGTGNFEGLWAAEPGNGNIKWLDDCHGDTYSAFSANNVVYGSGHMHYCKNIGGFVDTRPTHYHLMAYTKDATGTVQKNGQGGSGYGNFEGQPAPSIINYFPEFQIGTYTGQSQATWSLSGNNQYLATGGEFLAVNGQQQQGLVRFAIPSLSPKKRGPQVSGTAANPTLVALGSNAVRVNWQSNWDQDDQDLTYEVIRSDRSATPLKTLTATSQFWNRPALNYSDSTVEPGKTYQYRISASDGDGNKVYSNYVDITVPVGATLSSYAQKVIDDNATNYWRLNEDSGSALFDSAGGSDLTKGSGVSHQASGAIDGDSDGAAAFDGSSSGSAATNDAVPGPTTFSAEAWFKTTTIRGGKILGFGNSKSGNSSSYDRHIYMDNTGRLTFGVYPGTVKAIRSQKAYNDGQWHQVVASLSGAGTALSVDGKTVATDATVTSAQGYDGYWRIGGDNLSGWPNAGSSMYFNGAIDEVAIYPTALTGEQIRSHYTLSGRTAASNVDPVAAFEPTVNGLTVSFDGSSSSDPDGSVASYAWVFGDGATGTGKSTEHTYAATGSYNVTLTVTDDKGATNAATHTVMVTKANQAPVAAFESSAAGLKVSFDGSGSSDPDGSVASYAWQFGDEASGTGKSPDHTYGAAGSFDVTLTVTDDQGAQGSVTQRVTLVQNNRSPIATFTSSADGLKVSFDGSGSSDPDGSVASYAWDFGDGKAGTGVSPDHTYAVGGSYDVTLTVTDDKGATNAVTQSLSVVAPNTPPVAAFTSTADGLKVSFDGSTSSDPGGAVASYAWDFGDSTSGTGVSPVHTYAAAGSYDVKLTVTDDLGAPNTVTHTVTLTKSNQAPVAAFVSSAAGLKASFDASASTDDGTIASYAWDFGDTKSGTGKTIDHTYATAGSYDVTLTVTDDQGAANEVTKTVTVAAGAHVIAADDFNRTNANAWGSADVGGAWTLNGARDFSVSGGMGKVKLSDPTAGSRATLGSVSEMNFNVVSDLRIDRAATGNGFQSRFMARRVGTSDYRLSVFMLSNGSVRLDLVRAVAGSQSVLKSATVSGLTYSPGDELKVRFEVSGTGTTTLDGRVWKDGASEPAAAQVSAMDNTAALQSPGAFAVNTYLGSTVTGLPVIFSLDNLNVTGD